jgi:hypothetical protein
MMKTAHVPTFKELGYQTGAFRTRLNQSKKNYRRFCSITLFVFFTKKRRKPCPMDGDSVLPHAILLTFSFFLQGYRVSAHVIDLDMFCGKLVVEGSRMH